MGIKFYEFVNLYLSSEFILSFFKSFVIYNSLHSFVPIISNSVLESDNYMHIYGLILN